MSLLPPPVLLTVSGEGPGEGSQVVPRGCRPWHLAATSRHRWSSAALQSPSGSSAWCLGPAPSVCQLGGLLAAAGPAKCQTSAARIFKQLPQSSELLWPRPSAPLWGPGLLSSATSPGWCRLHESWAQRLGVGLGPATFQLNDVRPSFLLRKMEMMSVPTSQGCYEK